MTVLKNFDLIQFYVRARLEEAANENYIGYVWMALNPMLSALMFFLVFKIFLGNQDKSFIPFLFLGIVTWQWFSTCITDGSMSIYNNRMMYKRMYVHKIVFPWIETSVATFEFLVVFSLILVVYLLLGYPFTHYYAYIPSIVISQFVFTIGSVTLLASFIPYFVDLKHIIGFVLRLAFYPTGVIFNLNKVPDRYRWIVDINPIALSIDSLRNIVIYGKEPHYLGIAQMFGLGIVFYTIGSFIINKLDKEYAKVVL